MAIAAMIGVLLLAAVVYFRSSEQGAPVAQNRPTDAEADKQTGGAESTSFKDGEGNEVHLRSLEGKVVFINFWATWCPPCKIEMPSINQLYLKLKDREDVVFLMVDVDDDYQNASKFVGDNHYAFPVYTPFGPIPKAYLGGAIPTTVILDKTGKMVTRHEGAADFNQPEVEAFIRELL